MNTHYIDDHIIDTEYIILENIYDSSMQPLRQRELAQIAGASLGMTNSILKRLAQKGWITIKKINSRNIQYAVTIEGIKEINQRSYRYFKHTIRNTVYFKDILEDIILKARQRNISKVVLVGQSDLDFIVEHACRHSGLSFSKINDDNEELSPQETLTIYSEGIRSEKNITENFMPEKTIRTGRRKPLPPNVFYLSRLIIKQAAIAGNSGNKKPT